MYVCMYVHAYIPTRQSTWHGALCPTRQCPTSFWITWSEIRTKGPDGLEPIRVTRVRCYDHNFLRFSPIFGGKNGVFLKKQSYD
jgi:hypothetical protein